jgi:hypothetical protein
MLQYTGLSAQRILKAVPELSQTSFKEYEQLQIQAHLYEKLFSKSDSKGIVEPTPIQFLEKAPCLDRNGAAKDASIEAPSPFKICMSLSHLEKRLNQSNYEIELLALYLHEVAHLYGANETDAEALQSEILKMGPQFKQQWSFLFDDSLSVREDIHHFYESLRNIQISTDTDAQICGVLLHQNQKIQTLFLGLNVQTRNITILSLEEISRLHAAMVLVDYSLDFCGALAINSDFHKMKFNQKSEAPIKDLYPDPLNLMPFLDLAHKIAFSQYFLADLQTSLKIHRVTNGDRIALQKNLETLRGLVPAR